MKTKLEEIKSELLKVRGGFFDLGDNTNDVPPQKCGEICVDYCANEPGRYLGNVNGPVKG